MPEFNVVICGGGVAAVEGLLRLRRLAGDRVGVTLLCPNEQFHCRPLAITEPFARDHVRRYPMERVVSDTAAVWVRDRLARVLLDDRTVLTESGGELTYDALLLAIGGRESPAFEHAVLFTDRDDGAAFREVIGRVQSGKVRRIAFVLPDGPVWPVPLYELTLLTAAHARERGIDLHIDLVTPEGRPLKTFGEGGATAIRTLLTDAGVVLHAGAAARVESPTVVACGATQLDVDLVVTVPRVTGPAVPGIPAGPGWFIPIDDYCRVEDTDGHVFAAGDATAYPVKHGGLGTQQADTAAAGIAHLAGLPDRPAPFTPVIRGMLLTGNSPLYLSAHVVSGLGWRSHVYEEPPWPADEKIVAEELGPYLTMLEESSR
jgi:sulfide:quinone oxidoreductase